MRKFTVGKYSTKLLLLLLLLPLLLLLVVAAVGLVSAAPAFFWVVVLVTRRRSRNTVGNWSASNTWGSSSMVLFLFHTLSSQHSNACGGVLLLLVNAPESMMCYGGAEHPCFPHGAVVSASDEESAEEI